MFSRLLTVREAASALGISTRMLIGHVKCGELSYIAVGSGTLRQRRMFDEADLEAFKERQRRIEVWPPPGRIRRGVAGSSLNGEGGGFMERRAALKAERQKARDERKQANALTGGRRSRGC
ncbi:helix-turn-helix domain-containing protein [Azorhizobium oxalatiphilum]